MSSRVHRKIQKKDDKALSTAPGGGLLYHWDGKYRRVPPDYVFSSKITLKNAWLRYFLPDRLNKICPIRFFTGTDLIRLKTGRRNLSSFKMVIQFMIYECKRVKSYIDKLTEEEAIKMYNEVAGKVLSPRKNRRCEGFSWHSHVRHIQKYKKQQIVNQ